MKRERGIKLGFRIGLIMGSILSAVGIIGFFVLVFAVPYLSGYALTDVIMQKVYSDIAGSWQTEDLIQSITKICSLEEDNLSKVECVQEIFCKFYTYKFERTWLEEHSNLIVKSPEDLFVNGGICRDASIFYRSVLDNLKINNTFKRVPKHVYNLFYIGSKEYKLDQCANIIDTTQD